MSYSIYLNEPNLGGVIEFEETHHLAGGTYALGVTTEAWLSVTYNYGRNFYKTMGKKGIREIYGKTGAESIPVLDAAIAQLGDDANDDYWESTEGNAKRALCQLRQMAMMRPDGIWDGD